MEARSTEQKSGVNNYSCGHFIAFKVPIEVWEGLKCLMTYLHTGNLEVWKDDVLMVFAAARLLGLHSEAKRGVGKKSKKIQKIFLGDEFFPTPSPD